MRALLRGVAVRFVSLRRTLDRTAARVCGFARGEALPRPQWLRSHSDCVAAEAHSSRSRLRHLERPRG